GRESSRGIQPRCGSRPPCVLAIHPVSPLPGSRSIDWRGAPLGCAERPAYARPAGAPGTPSRPGPRLLPCRGRVAPPATDYPRPSAPALPAGQKARPPRSVLRRGAFPGVQAPCVTAGKGRFTFLETTSIDNAALRARACLLVGAVQSEPEHFEKRRAHIVPGGAVQNSPSGNHDWRPSRG